MVRLSFLGVVCSFFSSLLGLIFEPFKKHLAWKMLQRPHGLLHLFIFLRFLPLLVSDFFQFFFRRLLVFVPWSLRAPVLGWFFRFSFPSLG